MKQALLLALFIFAGLLSTSIQSIAQHPPSDSICDSYKTYYSIEEAMKEPLNVQKLDLSMQKLTVVPPEITQFENLVCLDLSFNRISTLPASFSSLKKLECLNLMGTRYMSKLPIVVSNIPNLKILDISDHPEWSAATYAEASKLLPNVTIVK